jgi:pantoate--beta-alanine ligase
MKIATDPGAVRSAVRTWRAGGQTTGFVATMGALHAGHLSLVSAARAAGATRLVASIFVNPKQFGPDEDLDSYPKVPEADAQKLRERGVDLLFLPASRTMYPPQSQTSVALSELPNHLCGLTRPVHFGGVATVVSMLFNIVEPDLAVFGQKDFQQLQVIRQLNQDLHFGIQIVGAPIVREKDGLAMSSRNAYLSTQQRERAPALHRSLLHAKKIVAAGETSADAVREAILEICSTAGTVDYIAIVNEETLEDVSIIQGPVRVALAVQVGSARLIDNMRLP